MIRQTNAATKYAQDTKTIKRLAVKTTRDAPFTGLPAYPKIFILVAIHSHSSS